MNSADWKLSLLLQKCVSGPQCLDQREPGGGAGLLKNSVEGPTDSGPDEMCGGGEGCIHLTLK